MKILTVLIDDEVAGDPQSSTRWIKRTLRWLQQQLRQQEIYASLATIRHYVRTLGYSLKSNGKKLALKKHPQRSEQFDYITNVKKDFLTAGKPVISVDVKKKEWIGNFKQEGRTWQAQAVEVYDPDFPSIALGKLIPFGIYDIPLNRGYIVAGTSHDPPEFAIEAIAWW